MYRVWLPTKVIILGLAIVGAICSPLYAEFGYKDVYQYDKKTEKWDLLEPADDTNDTAYMIVDYPAAGVEGNSNSSFSVKSTLNILPSPMGTKGARSFGIFGEPESIIHSSGPLTITVKPLTDNIGIDQNDDGEDWFVLPGTRNYAEWQFVYTVTNVGKVDMNDITVEENFSAEIEVKGSEDAWDVIATRGKVLIYRQNEKQFRFLWDGFSLKPDESASLTIDVKLGKNSAGKQHYGECNRVYELNSGGVLKLKLNGKQKSYDGKFFEVWVPCTPPSFCISLSATGTEWYIRKPGDYYTKMLEGTVSANGNAAIAITFSNFDDLRPIGSSQAIPVFYALEKDEESGEQNWITPQCLNENASLELRVSANSTSSWGMWQRVILGTQSPGMYSNVGVITFTLVNSQPAYVGN